MSLTMFIVVAFFSTVLAMIVHELGHLAAARRYGVPVSELAIGFGPVLCGFEVNGIRYNIRLLPLSSFVRLDVKRLRQQSTSRQLSVHLAGIAFNLLAALMTYGSVFGWINLLVAAANLLPLYQHDGWKCGTVLMRSLLGFKSRPVEWTFTFAGGLMTIVLFQKVIDIL